jgi:uncharacterized membrane protein YphA (DoxX/SURF4 family)
MKIVLGLARFIVGVLFIFSGLVKANDPLGLSYKMQEFFEVWGWHFLNDYTLAFSILMIAFEIIAGVAVLLGWKMNLFSWLLLLLIVFFTFLTGYALFSGKIRTCGCFGDCIPLTADQSFMKDIILLVLILFIFFYRKKIQPVFKPGITIGLLLLTTLFSFAGQWYVLKYLPVVDCLPYKKGNYIPEKMKVPPGAIPDSTAVTFVYEKEGKQLEIINNNFPDDFDDSIYHFIKRYDKLVRKGNAEPAIKDFTLTTLDDIDSTQDLLAKETTIALLFYNEKETNLLPSFENTVKALQQKNVSVYIVTSTPDKIKNKTMLPVLKCDYVAIKTAARANPTLYLIKKGVILNKWAGANFDKVQQETQR